MAGAPLAPESQLYSVVIEPTPLGSPQAHHVTQITQPVDRQTPTVVRNSNSGVSWGRMRDAASVIFGSNDGRSEQSVSLGQSPQSTHEIDAIRRELRRLKAEKASLDEAAQYGVLQGFSTDSTSGASSLAGVVAKVVNPKENDDLRMEVERLKAEVESNRSHIKQLELDRRQLSSPPTHEKKTPELAFTEALAAGQSQTIGSLKDRVRLLERASSTFAEASPAAGVPSGERAGQKVAMNPISEAVRSFTQKLSKKEVAATAGKTVAAVAGQVKGAYPCEATRNEASVVESQQLQLQALRKELALQEARHVAQMESLKRMIPAQQQPAGHVPSVPSTLSIQPGAVHASPPHSPTNTWIATQVGESSPEGQQWVVSSAERDSFSPPTIVTVTTPTSREIHNTSWQTPGAAFPPPASRAVASTPVASDPLHEAIGAIEDIDGYLAEIQVGRQASPSSQWTFSPAFAPDSCGRGPSRSDRRVATVVMDPPSPSPMAAPPQQVAQGQRQAVSAGRVVSAGRYVLQLLPDVGGVDLAGHR